MLRCWAYCSNVRPSVVRGRACSHAFMGMVSGRRVDTEVELEKLTRPLGEIGRKAQRQVGARRATWQLHAHCLPALLQHPPRLSGPTRPQDD